MGGRNCCVRNCRRRSHDHRGRKIPNGLTFHCFPAWRRNEGGQTSELTRRRRAAWVAAVGRSNITFNHIPTSMRVCSRHFHSGKPAYEMLESDPDWVPSLQLGHSEGNRRRTERLLPSEQSERPQKQRGTAETRPSDASRTPPRESAGGKPAYEMLESDPDWVPSLQLGHSEGNRRRTERLLPSEQSERPQKQRGTAETRPSDASRTPPRESAGGPARPAVLPWRDIKSRLQTVLLRQTGTNKQPGDETLGQTAAVKKMDVSFRDFFRDALEASLEASSRSRTLSARQPSISGEYKVELNFKLPPVKEENQRCEESSSSSSSCLNCVRLQRRITELQEKLSRLTGEQDDTEASPVLSKAPLPPDQDLQSPETVHMEEAEPEWMEPLSPPQVLPRESDENVDSANKLAPAGSSNLLKRTLRRPPRFQKAWLKAFWFLRYSQTLDQMWCHVCRLHADKSHQHLALIKGSRMFKVHNIKKHSDSNYHKDNMKQHMLHMCDLKI